MATSIDQYTPVFLPGEPSLIEESGTPQSTGPQRVGHDQSYPMHIEARLFFFFCLCQLCVRVEHEGGTAVRLVGTLLVPRVQGHGLPLLQELRS